MSHIAIVKSSARMAQQRASESRSDTTSKDSSTISGQIVDPTSNELSQMSIISLSNNESGDSYRDVTLRRQSHTGASSNEASSRISKNVKATPKPVVVPLETLKTISDIEACVDDDLRQLNVLNDLEQRWKAITSNINEVSNHLRECCGEVTEASMGCLEVLVRSVDLTCDRADSEMKALYDLITKCDELTTKLSAASSFCGEVKTLRKSIETLDNLYKLRPSSHQSKPFAQT